MPVLEILIVAFGVSIDAFAVSVGGALCPSRFSRRHCAFNAALFFGSFQFIMPVIGFFAAGSMAALVAAWDHYLACALLSGVGGKMIWEGIHRKPEKKSCPAPASGGFFTAGNLVLPAIATSMDALAVGAGLAFAGKQLWFPAAAMGVITAGVSATGVYFGSSLGKFAGERVLSAVGGSAIILIGVKIVLNDLGLLNW